MRGNSISTLKRSSALYLFMLDNLHGRCITIPTSKTMETTGKAFVNHWSWAASKGIMNRNTAGALGAACSQVIKTLDNWETVDVSKLDPDQVVQRFKNLRSQDFIPKSLQTYETRFKRALDSYLAYVKDPGAWKPVSQTRAPRAPRPTRTAPEPVAMTLPAPAAPARTPVELTPEDVADYNFPLRKNLSARLILPRDLNEAEAKRLQAYIALLVLHAEQPQKEET